MNLSNSCFLILPNKCSCRLIWQEVQVLLSYDSSHDSHLTMLCWLPREERQHVLASAPSIWTLLLIILLVLSREVRALIIKGLIENWLITVRENWTQLFIHKRTVRWADCYEHEVSDNSGRHAMTLSNSYVWLVPLPDIKSQKTILKRGQMVIFIIIMLPIFIL